MTATIDKGSITAVKTDDVLVFKIGFDFTDDTLDPSQGWLVSWKHAEFTYNTNTTGAEFSTAATKAMTAARKPAAETTLENTLKAAYGVTVVRNNPVVTEIPQKVQIMAVDSAVVFKTQVV